MTMDWDQRYQNQDTPWDHGEAAPAIDEVIQRQRLEPGVEVLVLGCGLGHDVQAWANAGFSTTGVDISATALQRAEESYGIDRMRWLLADLFASDLAKHGCYDVIWEHTCFCAIPLDWRESYVEAVFRVLKPGGIFCCLFFTDTGNPPGEGPPFNVNRDEVMRLFDSRFTLQWEKSPERSYDSRVGREWLMSWKKA
jgi:SAM-dependent methyltransferase